MNVTPHFKTCHYCLIAIFCASVPALQASQTQPLKNSSSSSSSSTSSNSFLASNQSQASTTTLAQATLSATNSINQTCQSSSTARMEAISQTANSNNPSSTETLKKEEQRSLYGKKTTDSTKEYDYEGIDDNVVDDTAIQAHTAFAVTQFVPKSPSKRSQLPVEIALILPDQKPL